MDTLRYSSKICRKDKTSLSTYKCYSTLKSASYKSGSTYLFQLFRLFWVLNSTDAYITAWSLFFYAFLSSRFWGFFQVVGSRSFLKVAHWRTLRSGYVKIDVELLVTNMFDTMRANFFDFYCISGEEENTDDLRA